MNEVNLNYYRGLFYKIGIDNKFGEILDTFNTKEAILLFLYFQIKEGGWHLQWKRSYDNWNITDAIYICESEYEGYCKYLDLIKDLKTFYPIINAHGII